VKFKLSLFGVALLTCSLASSSASYGAPPTDACTLLTAEQVSGVLDAKVGAGKPLVAKVCIWPGAPGKRVTLTLITPQAFVYAKTPTGHGMVKTDVSGIGDDAVYVSAPGTPTTLTVKKGNAAFTIMISGFSDDQTKVREKTLALAVCSKL
jgi:hypothetical protein